MAAPQVVNTTAFGLSAYGICWDENKSGMYITNRPAGVNKLNKVTRAGAVLSTVNISISDDGGVDTVGGLDIVNNQHLYVTNSTSYENTIAKLTLAGVKLTVYSPPHDSGHYDIAWDGTSLFTISGGPDLVYKMTTECVVQSSFVASDPMGIAADPAQDLLFVPNYAGHVRVYTRAGSSLGYFSPGLGQLSVGWWDDQFLWILLNGEFKFFAEPPPTPTVTAPNGGEAIDATADLTWTRGALQYLKGQPYYGEVQLSTDNGVAWNTIVAQSAVNTLTANHDFSNIAYTAQALVRVREFNDPTYRLNSAYDQSNAVFTIGVAPLAPTNLSPSGTVLDVAQNNSFSWISHDTDNITAFQLIIYEAGTNTISHDTGEVAGDGPYTLAGSTIAGEDYQSVVRSKDTHGLWGPYSQRAAFTGSTKPIVAITTPVNGGTYNKGLLTITANFADAESDTLLKYEATLKDGLGNVIEYSGEVVSSIVPISYRPDTILENNTAYTAEIYAWDDTGLKSAVATTSFTTDFIPPAKPLLSVAPGSGKLILSIINPVSVPAADRNHIYKKIHGAWIRIAKDWPVNTEYEDYAVQSDELTEYKVIAISVDETTNTSDIVSSITTFNGTWLHDITDPAGTICRFKWDGSSRSSEWTAEAVKMKFAGRTNVVVDVGESEDESISLTIQTEAGTGDREALISLIKRKATLCYRDGRGRKLFGFVEELPETDEIKGNSFNITIEKTDYTEVV